MTMPATARTITRDDLMPMADYAAVRTERRRALTEIKRHRRIEVGPSMTFHFENFDTMLHQVHEMLYIERGGDPQIEDELAAYNPLVPKGRELVATLMIEIDDPARRARELARLGDVERTIRFEFDGHAVPAEPESDQERTREDGKASSVHFLHFPFTDEQAEAFRRPGTVISLVVGHEHYGHAARLPERTRAALACDLA
jgi:hypothetical protein